MKRTYLLEFKGKPIIYVFDEDGVVSYTISDKEAWGKFFAEGIRLRQSPLREMGVKMDYVTVGNDLLKMVYSIAVCRNSEELLVYLKKMREFFEYSGLKLKCAEGILQKYYNDPKRITQEIAVKNLTSIYRYGT